MNRARIVEYQKKDLIKSELDMFPVLLTLIMLLQLFPLSPSLLMPNLCCLMVRQLDPSCNLLVRFIEFFLVDDFQLVFELKKQNSSS